MFDKAVPSITKPIGPFELIEPTEPFLRKTSSKQREINSLLGFGIRNFENFESTKHGTLRLFQTCF